MPTGVFVRTEKYRINMGNAMRGKRRSAECINKHKPKWTENLHKASESNRGKHRSEETKKKISIAKKGIKSNHIPWNKGKKNPYCTGINHPNWKGGISKNKDYLWRLRRDYELRKINADGSHTHGEWELLKIQYGFRCPACGKYEPEIKLTEDHIIPLSKGGSDFIENIQPLCRSCNSIKRVKIIKYPVEIKEGEFLA